MSQVAQDHVITLTLVQVPPAEIAAGVNAVLKVRAECSAGCDLRGTIGHVLAEENEVIKEFYFTQFYGVTDTDALVLKAPATPGEHTWTVVFPEQEKNGITYAEVSTSCTFKVKESHKTTMAVWDVDAPVLRGAPFTMKVGIRCSVDCQLAGKEIEIYDHHNTLLTTARLGASSWQNSEALYWTNVELQAPEHVGVFTWKASFSEPGGDDPHLGSSMSFGLKVVEQPNCSLKVMVTDKESKLPINEAYVVLHPYRERTSKDGIATFALTEGVYHLFVLHGEHGTYRATIHASGSMTVSATLEPKPVVLYDQG